ncbi:general transcription factor 3C polypeptide 1 [Prorops nasuta]|uniref:general transcription factor 3C polypeptide 1 n=1 Tax=Prorops nasuta TaxID=863751 RepID=UPI0034CD2104
MMASNISTNLIDIVVDEVALEGLDGITLDALWIRLANRLSDPIPLLQPFKEQVWSICLQIKEFEFYELNVPRDKLIIVDRYEYVDPDIGTILEPDNLPEDIYPHCLINDVSKGIKGSCSTYYTRKNISSIVKGLNLNEAETNFGQCLVIVASQYLRDLALMGETVCPMLELTPMQYCFLERVGRSRYHGEVTQGKLSLSLLKEDPKSLFYHRKYLLKHKLITKQIHHQKSAGHCCSGSLLHLPRFFVERKPKIIFLAEQVITILKTKNNYVAEYDEIKKQLQIENCIKKLFKTAFFQKVVKTDLKIPYRMLYPHAEKSEWQQKQDPTKEKMIRVVQLVDPNIDISESWNREEIHDDEDTFELNISNQLYSVPFLKQANSVVEESKSDGICQGELAKKLGLTKLQSRTFMRNLTKAKIVATFMNDVGRQRLTKYVSKKFEKNSEMSKRFETEMHKIKELTKTIINNNDSIRNQQFVMETFEAESNENNNKNEEFQEKSITSPSELNTKFSTINRILHKYNISKYRKYKCTSFNFLKRRISEEQSKKYGNNKESSTSSKIQLVNNMKTIKLFNNVKANLVAQKPINTGKQVNDIFGFMEDVHMSETRDVSTITYRLLKRANMIIESVKEHQVIDDMTKLMKMINEEEEKEGYIVKIDKKSLIRLLQKLAKDNLVKNIKLTLNANGKEKHLTFVCDPSIDTDHTVIKSAVEQAKIKFCLRNTQPTRIKNVCNKVQSNTESLHNQEKDEGTKVMKQILPPTSIYDFSAGRRYGYSPKFIRMRAVHFLLYYLAYEHPGEQSLSKEKQIEILRKDGYNIPDSLQESMGTIYSLKVGWKMFIPPLPKHSGWPEGWTLMCDVLLRIPLSIFVKIHNVSFIINDLDKYLNHPIQKHYLVKDLPPNIRNTLLYARKYIFGIHDTVKRLCYIGLIQFGPQRLKEKDQVFVYVNRKTELMDTTSSAPSYHKIEDKVYPITRYTFNQTQVVEKYWYDMWNICINTTLGGRQTVVGKDILLEDLNRKVAMIEATIARTAEEAVLKDTGEVPGDKRGAAGIDSAFFAHLKRNWNWSSAINLNNSKKFDSRSVKNPIGEARGAYFSKIQANPVKFTEFSGLKKVTGPTAVHVTELKDSNQDEDQESSDTKKHEVFISQHNSKQKSFVRRVLPRKKKLRSRVKYDEIDYRALQRMHKLRVDWDQQEDNILLVCKVAMMYLCPNPRKQLVSFSAVRDVLRTFSYNSYNKTSRACQRRLLYMMRQPKTINSVILGVEEIKQNFYINTRFGDIVETLKNQYPDSYEYEQRVTDVFKNLVSFIAKKFYDIAEMGPKEPISFPKTVQEFNFFYDLLKPTKPFANRGFTKDVKTVNDIHAATINTVIHSSMCCGKDRRAWAYQLFKVYQQYPETLLRNAMAKIRTDQMVTVKKNYMCAIKKHGTSLPMSSSQYQLSTNYIYKFQTKWPYDVFKESYQGFLRLLDWCNEQLNNLFTSSNGTEILPLTGGIITLIHDYMANSQIDFDIEVPDQIIMLDPRIAEADETYLRIAQRYHDILMSMDDVDSDKEQIENEGINNKRKKYISLNPFIVDALNDKDDEDSGNKGFSDKSDKDENCFRDLGEAVDNDTTSESDGEISLDEEDNEELNDRIKLSLENGKGDGFTRKRASNPENEAIEEPTKKRVKLDKGTDAEDILNPNVPKTIMMETNEEDENFHLILTESSRSNSDEENKLVDDTRVVMCDDNLASKETNEETDKSKQKSSARVSDMIKNAKPEMLYSTPYFKTDDANDIQKRYTRIALLRMREELNDLAVSENHHAHEYFAVNSFKILYSLKLPGRNEPFNCETFLDQKIPSDLLPLSLKVVNEIIEETSKSAIFPKDIVSYADLKKSVMKLSTMSWSKIDALYRFVRDKKEIGASDKELMEKFRGSLGRDFYSIISSLTKNHIFLRSGVTTPRYIHCAYVEPWLIQSYKIYRLIHEANEPLPQKSLFMTDTEPPENEENSLSDPRKVVALISKELLGGSAKEEEMQEMMEEGEKNEVGESNDNECETKKRMQKKRTCLLPQRDVYRAAKQLDFNTVEEIRVVMKPWIRIDGALNRRVLDRMLGAILAYCLAHPAVSLAKIQNRFVPALQPFHTRELVEILIKLGCLERKLLKRPKVTLFSKPVPLFSEKTDEWINEEETILEPSIKATTKFGIFLSTKCYSNDFFS